MEPNTYWSAAAAEIDDDGLSSLLAQSLLSPSSFFQPPSHGVAFAPISGSGSPCMVDDGSLAVDGHAAAQSLPSSSFFPAPEGDDVLAALESMAGDDVVADLQSPAASGVATTLGGEPWQAPADLPSWTASGMLRSACPSEGAFSGFPLSVWDVPVPDNSIIAGGQSLETMVKPPEAEESRYNVGNGARVAGSRPSNHQSSSMDTNHSRSTPKLSMGANKSSSGAASSGNNGRPVNFTDADKEILMKDKQLQELVKTDPKKVKRTIANRIGFAKSQALKEMHTLELERQVDKLQSERNTLSVQLLLLQDRSAELKTEHKMLSIMVQELELQGMLKDAVTESLQAELQALEPMKINNICTTSEPRNDA